MEIIDKLKQHDLWEQFLEYKISRGDLVKRDIDDLSSFVENKEYVPVIESLERNEEFSTPNLLEINKTGVQKKRLVFSFNREENYVLKMIAYLLKSYDYLFCDNLYSFRNDTGVKRAVTRMMKLADLGKSYTYKADIHDYFNSIDTDRILELLRSAIPDEKWLYLFFQKLFSNPYAIKDGNRIQIKKGVMAGTATAGFLANLYLSDMDRFFWEREILYARYSDDIIVVSDSAQKVQEYEAYIKEFLNNKGLEINSKKEIRTCPGEKIEFLGFELSPDETNVSDISIKKIKAKIKRKTRALYRWKLRTNASDERTAKALIRFLNNKFYNNSIHGEITWCRWYFPLITTDDKLKLLDDYSISCIRYLYTGRYSKKNYNLRYSTIQDMGFKSLVNSFWKHKKGEA